MIETNTRIINHRYAPQDNKYTTTPVRKIQSINPYTQDQNKENTYTGNERVTYLKHIPAKVIKQDQNEDYTMESAKVITLEPRVSRGAALSLRYQPDTRESITPIRYQNQPQRTYTFQEDPYDYEYESKYPNSVEYYQQPNYYYEDQKPNYYYEDQKPNYYYEDKKPEYYYKEEPQYYEEEPQYYYEDPQPEYYYENSDRDYYYPSERPNYYIQDEQPYHDDNYYYEDSQPVRYVYEDQPSSGYVSGGDTGLRRTNTPGFYQPQGESGRNNLGKQQYTLTSTVYIRPLDKVPQQSNFNQYE